MKLEEIKSKEEILIPFIAEDFINAHYGNTLDCPLVRATRRVFNEEKVKACSFTVTIEKDNRKYAFNIERDDAKFDFGARQFRVVQEIVNRENPPLTAIVFTTKLIFNVSYESK